MHGLSPELSLDALVYAVRPMKNDFEESLLDLKVIEAMLTSASQPASGPGRAHFRETAQRALHVPRYITIVAFIKSLHSVVIKQVEGLEGGR